VTNNANDNNNNIFKAAKSSSLISKLFFTHILILQSFVKLMELLAGLVLRHGYVPEKVTQI
jgi:hypothetical protein